MNKRILIIMALICCRLCSQTIAPNNVRTQGGDRGTYFWDGSNARHYVPKNANTTTIFAAGIWIGGYDQNGNLHTAAQTYRQSGTDFYMGNGVDNIYIDIYSNQTFSVSKAEIELFQQDFADGFINLSHPKIFNWPGLGHTVNGVLITAEYAPFIDLNSNNLYEPNLGEYPKIKGEEMEFSVYNDYADIHTESNGEQLGFNFYSSLYGYNCLNDSVIDNTIFIDLVIENKSNNTYDSLYLGMWVDGDLGKYGDDYVGSIPEKNAFYFYNGDANDEVTQNGYGASNIPAQSIAFVNKPMNTFLYYSNTNSNTIGNPDGPQHFYNYITGTWGDGSPWEWGGDGYNGGTYPTKYFWPSSPNLTGSNVWSECSEANAPDDRRGVGAVKIHRLAPNQRDTVRIAFTTHWGIQYPCPDINSTPNSKVSREIQYIKDLVSDNFANCQTTKNIFVTQYIDANNNCTKENNEYNLNVNTVEVKDTNNNIYFSDANIEGLLRFRVPNNNIYTVAFNDTSYPYLQLNCNQENIRTVSVIGTDETESFGFSCLNDSIDLSVSNLTTPYSTFSHYHQIRFKVNENQLCLNNSLPNYKIHFYCDRNIHYENFNIEPDTIFGNTAVWNVNSNIINNFVNVPTGISFRALLDTALLLTDTIGFKLWVDTLNIDHNYANNTIVNRRMVRELCQNVHPTKVSILGSNSNRFTLKPRYEVTNCITTPNAKSYFVLDPNTRFVSSSIAPDSVINNTLIWNNIFGQSHYAEPIIVFEVVNNLVDTLCFVAHMINIDPILNTTTEYSSTLCKEMNAICTNNFHNARVMGITSDHVVTGDTSSNVFKYYLQSNCISQPHGIKIELPLDFSILNANPSPSIILNNIAIWDSITVMNAMYQIDLRYVIPNSFQSGDDFCVKTSIDTAFGETSIQDNFSEECFIVQPNCGVDSIDPLVQNLNYMYLQRGAFNNCYPVYKTEFPCSNQPVLCAFKYDAALTQFITATPLPDTIIGNVLYWRNKLTNSNWFIPSVKIQVSNLSNTNDVACFSTFIDTLLLDSNANNNQKTNCYNVYPNNPPNALICIEGRVTVDYYANCQQEILEGLGNIRIKAVDNLGNQYFTSSANNGYYSFCFPNTIQNVRISLIDSANYSANCTGFSRFVSIMNTNNYYNIRFIIDEICNFSGFNNQVNYLHFDAYRDISANHLGNLRIEMSRFDCMPDSVISVKINMPNTTFDYTSNNVFSLTSPNSLEYNYPNFGTFSNFYQQVNFKHNANIGDTICGNLIMKPVASDNNPQNNVRNFCAIVRNSFDPNEKTCISKSMDTHGNFLGIDTLNYTIHFQNLGTDYAYRVIVIDTLDESLDINTLKVFTASHAYELVLYNNILKFTFNNINLDWASRNDIASKGYITYSIQPKSTIPYHTFIHNNASIYFDNNLPIVTNTTENQYMPYPLGIHNVNNSTNYFTISPNPVRDWLTIKPTARTPYRMQLKIINSLGMLVDIIDMKSFATQQYNTHKLASGVYFIQYAHGGDMQCAKFVKQD